MTQVMTNTQKQTITTREVAAFLGVPLRTARDWLVRWESEGLKRKGRGRGTRYSRAEFLEFFEREDTRP